MTRITISEIEKKQISSLHGLTLSESAKKVILEQASKKQSRVCCNNIPPSFKWGIPKYDPSDNTTITGMSTTSASANLGRSVKLDDIYVYREANYGDADTLKNYFDKVTTAAGGEQAVKDAAGDPSKIEQGSKKDPCRFLVLVDSLISARGLDWATGVKTEMEEIQEIICPGAPDEGEVSDDLTAEEYCDPVNSPFSKTYIAKNADTGVDTCLLNDWNQIRQLGIKYGSQYTEGQGGCYDIVQLKGLGTYMGGTTVKRRIRKTFYRINYDCVTDIWKYDDGGRQFVWEPMGDPSFYVPTQKTEYDKSGVDPSWNYGADDQQISTTTRTVSVDDKSDDGGLETVISTDTEKTYTPAQQKALQYLSRNKSNRSNIVGKTEF
tara:strand:+ start:54 stop:1190 length:1137 start_codon:yes stop_codon:yes gene_type:complete